MTVKELIEILNNVDNKEIEVKQGSLYGREAINGFFYYESGDNRSLILSDLKVQPRA